MTWSELEVATDFRDLVQKDPQRWEPYVDFEKLNQYVEFLWEEGGF